MQKSPTKEDEEILVFLRDRKFRESTIDFASAYQLIDIKGNLSTIELTLTAITVAAIILKISFGELATQIGSLLTGGSARAFLDVSISVGFIAIVIATFQIPRHFTDALIYSNLNTMRILFMVCATPTFIAMCFARVVRRAMIKAVSRGFIVTAILYLLISEVAQVWVPTTRTYFLREVAEVVAAILAFMLAANWMVKVKINRFFVRGMRD